MAQFSLAAGVSRREAIAAGGLAIAGAAGLTPATPDTTPIGIVFGGDKSGYIGFHRHTSLAVGLRWYIDVENSFPAAWPKPFPVHTHMTLSLRPKPSDLLAGKLDGRLKAIIDSAPTHSELTFWHENTSHNPLHYPPDVNDALTARKMQEYGHNLCQGSNVLFGVITVGPVAAQVNWISPGLDWYGDDLYEFKNLRGLDNTFSKTKVTARLFQNLHTWRTITGLAAPPIRICETNSPYNSHRSALFTTIANFLARHNGNRMLTFWSRKGTLARGGLDGPWPPSRSVIRTLVSLAKEYDWKTLPLDSG